MKYHVYSIDLSQRWNAGDYDDNDDNNDEVAIC